MVKQKQMIKDKRVMWIILGLLLVLIIAYFVSSNSGEWFLDRGEDIEQFEGPIFENAVLRQYNTDTPPMKHTGGPQLFERANIHDIRQSMLINENNALEFLDLREMVRISEDELNEVLEGKGILEGHAKSFLQAQRRHNVNVFYLVAHALVETGHGRSELAEGIEADDEVYYNFFGIGAFDSGAVIEGHAYAVAEEWTSPEAAIIGGAEFISKNYVNNNQFTTYAMRWNPDNPTQNQYATDINWSSVIAEITASYYDYFDIEPRKFYRNYYNES